MDKKQIEKEIIYDLGTGELAIELDFYLQARRENKDKSETILEYRNSNSDFEVDIVIRSNDG